MITLSAFLSKIAAAIFFFIAIASLDLSAINISAGQISTHSIDSEYIGTRSFNIFTPAGVVLSNSTKVIYMHDGQMLFDKSNTWNNQEWMVDEVSNKVVAENGLNFIVVGIMNAGSEKRWFEYFPQKALTVQQKEIADQEFTADNYLNFLTKELKPFLLNSMNVSRNSDDHFLMGSSMGGLISMYGVIEEQDEFGGFAAISTHWPGGDPDDTKELDQSIQEYLNNHFLRLSNKRIYFDYGTKTLDAYYEQYQREVDRKFSIELQKQNRYQSIKFDGASHDENSWSQRLHIPLEFLLDE